MISTKAQRRRYSMRLRGTIKGDIFKWAGYITVVVLEIWGLITLDLGAINRIGARCALVLAHAAVNHWRPKSAFNAGWQGAHRDSTSSPSGRQLNECSLVAVPLTRNRRLARLRETSPATMSAGSSTAHYCQTLVRHQPRYQVPTQALGHKRSVSVGTSRSAPLALPHPTPSWGTGLGASFLK